MKVITVAVFISIFISCQNKQETKAPFTNYDSVCIAAEKLAEDDFQKKKLRLFAERISGNIYDSIMLSDFGIQTYEDTKQDDEISPCYQDAMDSLLLKKFNQNVVLSAYRKSQKLEYLHKTGVSPEDLAIIDLSDRMQEQYLMCFTNITSKKGISQETQSRIKQLLLNEGLNPNEIAIKLEIDTNGHVASIHSKKQINANTKSLILQELNKNGEIGYFEMEGKRKIFIFPVDY
jgi:hypothetical protein